MRTTVYVKQPKRYGCGSLVAGLALLWLGWSYARGLLAPPGAAPPAAAGAESGAAGGLATADRQEAYRAYHHAGLEASAKADAAYPADTLGRPGNLERRRDVYEAAKGDARRLIFRRFGIGEEELRAIDREGQAARWPLEPRPGWLPRG